MSRRFVVVGNRVLVEGELDRAAVVVDGEKIEAVLQGDGDLPEDVPVFDAGDRVVMPGVIDAQVRIGDPGREDWEGFSHATRAAAAGGVTTLGDMPLPCRPVTGTIEALEAKRWAANGRLHVDVGLHAGLLAGYQDQLEPLIDAGVLSFMAFLTDPGQSEFRQIGRTDLESAMPVLARRGVPLVVHAEKAPPKKMSRRGARKTSGAGAGEVDARSYGAYCASRPSRWEIDAVELMADLVAVTGCHVHIAPLASTHAVPVLEAGRQNGLRLSGGTSPHYLTFAAEEIPDGDPRWKCTPPIRGAEHREGLCRALAAGTLEVVSSDHSPAPATRRQITSGDLRRASSGIASLQLLLPALWTVALGHGMGLAAAMETLTRRPAELLGLGDRKGRLAAGHDADLVVWDPESTFEVVGAALEHRHPQTPWAGATLFGVVHRTWVRGHLAFDSDGGFGDPRGELVRRA